MLQICHQDLSALRADWPERMVEKLILPLGRRD